MDIECVHGCKVFHGYTVCSRMYVVVMEIRCVFGYTVCSLIYCLLMCMRCGHVYTSVLRATTPLP